MSDWLGFGVVGFVVFFLLSGAGMILDPPDVEQPIAFNHRKHVVENAMDCSECHPYYETETFSGVPSADTCSLCHEEPLGESAEEAKLVEILQRGAAPEWKTLFRQPPHVFYSHRRHVVVAKMECDACHGSIGQSEAPPTRVTRLTMDDCLDCHRKERAGTDCTTCHR